MAAAPDASAPPRRFIALPGPRGLPLLGNALQLDPATMHRRFERWSHEFGPLFRMRIGRRHAVVVSDPALIPQLLRDRPNGFTRLAAFQPMFAEMGVDFLFSAEGETWKRQRRVWMASLNAQQIRPFHDGLAAITGRLLERWRRAADDGQAVDVLAEAMLYTVDVTMLFAFGYDADTLGGRHDTLRDQIAHLFRAIGRRLLVPIPYWRYFKLPADRALDRALAALRGDVQNVIDAARQRLEQDSARREKPTCLLEALLVARDADGTQFSDDEIFANTFGALLAGEDTTANTIAWVLYYLGQTPAVFAGVRGEADDLADAGGGVRHADGFPAWFRFTDAVINETMRLRPIAPFIFLSARQDTVVGDVAVPAGTDVILLLRAAAGADPDRSPAPTFAPHTGEPAPDASPGRVATLPFGFGPRLCPGRNLALAEIRSVALMVARHFELEPVPGPGPVDERVSFTMSPVNVRLRFRWRGSA